MKISRCLCALFGALLMTLVGSPSAFAIDLPPNHGKKAVTPVSSENWADGKLQRTVDTLANGSKVVVNYDRDGKTILLKQEFRKDGSLAYQRHRLLDGSTIAVRYKTSGEPQMVRTHNPATGAFTLTHYRVGKSQEVWFKSEMDLTKDEATWRYFAKDKSVVKRVVGGNGMAVTVTDPKGKDLYKQDWKKVSGAWQLQSVTDLGAGRRFNVEIDATGKAKQKSVDYLKATGAVDRTDSTNKEQVPAAWLEEFDGNDDPTFPE